MAARRSWGFYSAGIMALTLLVNGCASDTARLARAASASTCARENALVQETHAQLAALRAEMAETRIAGARKEAELQELRRQIETLRAERALLKQVQAKHRDAIATQEATINTLRSEQDANIQGPSAAREETSEMPSAALMAATAPALEDKVKALEASVVALSVQLGHLRQAAAEQSAAVSMEPNPPISIRVKRGDTLGKLATAYNVTVDAIREANGLTGDLIVVGQRLFIPRAAGPSQ